MTCKCKENDHPVCDCERGNSQAERVTEFILEKLLKDSVYDLDLLSVVVEEMVVGLGDYPNLLAALDSEAIGKSVVNLVLVGILKHNLQGRLVSGLSVIKLIRQFNSYSGLRQAKEAYDKAKGGFPVPLVEGVQLNQRNRDIISRFAALGAILEAREA